MIGSPPLHLLIIVNGDPKRPRAVPKLRPKANFEGPQLGAS